MPVPCDGAVRVARMGCNSHGPLMLVPEKDPCVLVDPQSLQSFVPEHRMNAGSGMHDNDIRVSADGQTFVWWTRGFSPVHFTLIRFAGRQSTSQTGWSDSYNGSWIQPTADGSLLLKSNRDQKLCTSAFKPVSAETFADQYLLPTEDPGFFLSIRPEGNRGNAGGKGKSHPGHSESGPGHLTQLSIWSAAGCQRVLTLDHLEPMTSSRLPTEWGYIHGQPRVHFLPEVKLLVTLPETDDAVVLRSLDLREALKKSPQPQLAVISRPETRVEPGSDYAYAIDAVSTAGGVKYRVESGPQGMTVSDAGRVQWHVPASAKGTTASVLIVLTDASGKEIFHNFKIAVGGPAANRLPEVASRGKSATRPSPATAGHGTQASPPEKATRGPAVARSKPAAPRGDSHGDSNSEEPDPGAASPTGVHDFTQIDPQTVEIPSNRFSWVPGLDDRTMLGLCGDKLAILGPDGITIQKQLKLPASYVRIAERAEYFVAVTSDPVAIDILDKKTLKRVRHATLPGKACTDLALHRGLP